MNNKKNPIDAILDPKDSSNITLYDEKDNGVEFEQVCLVPLRNQIYCILKPVKALNGLADDEALVFQIYTDEERRDTLIMITDSKIIDEVFDIYYKLLDQNKKA